jgi:hypothetical protein
MVASGAMGNALASSSRRSDRDVSFPALGLYCRYHSAFRLLNCGEVPKVIFSDKAIKPTDGFFISVLPTGILLSQFRTGHHIYGKSLTRYRIK